VPLKPAQTSLPLAAPQQSRARRGKGTYLPRTLRRSESQQMSSCRLRTKHFDKTCSHLISYRRKTEHAGNASLKPLGGRTRFHEESKLINTRLCPLAPHWPTV